MRLSVCCATNDPGPRLRALLGPLREIADQIVVAVDSRVDAGRLGHYAAIADRLVRFEYADPMESASAWLASLCEGDWILRLDGDEVLSPALVEGLPRLLGRDDVHQFHVRCRWLFPDAGHYLDEPPWNYLSPRLVRNDPATLRFEGRLHSGVITDGVPAAVLLDTPYYHLDSLLRDEATRRAKLKRRYHGAEERWKPYGSDGDSTLYYLPESAREPRLADVPAGDREAIARVLDARGPEAPTPPGLDVPLIRRCEIERHWSHRKLRRSAYSASLELLDRDLTFRPGQHRPVRLRVTNRGDEPWPGGSLSPWVRIAYRWLDETSAAEEFRTDLPGPVAPGRTVVAPLLIAAPAEPGTHPIEIDLVHEHVRWFQCSTRALIQVAERSRPPLPRVEARPPGRWRSLRDWRQHRAR
ncbi:MAG TPA: hypothetical protein VGS57_05720 [Thermoanaerobaculia bacterium]|nr:hypothetical protein [Thermoanaerobaculia bacterium]